MAQDDYRRPAVQHYGPRLPTREQWLAAVPGKRLPAQDLAQHVPNEHEHLCRLMEWHDATSRSSVSVGVPDTPGLTPAQRERVWESFLALVECRAEEDDELYTVEQVLALCGSQAEQQGAACASSRRSDGISGPRTFPCFDNEYFVIYLYAGHQRSGDIHQVSRRLAIKYGFHVRVLPLDVVYHDSLCDMLSGTTQRFWQHMVGAAVFLGIIAAPPCETFSVARWQAILNHDGGPAPVRTSKERWGRMANPVRRRCKQLWATN